MTTKRVRWDLVEFRRLTWLRGLVGALALATALSAVGAGAQEACGPDNYFTQHPGPLNGRTNVDPCDPYAPGGIPEAVVPAFPDGNADTARFLADFQRALDGGRPLTGFFTPDAVLVYPEADERIQGRDAVVAELDDLLHGAFAGRFEVADSAVAGDSAMEAGHFVGTQIGPFLGTEATGAAVRVPYTADYELDGGRIAELRLDLPTGELLAQLAAGPAGEITGPDRFGNPS